MNTATVQNLVYHIVRYAKGQGIHELGATKLIKLLYLVDYEFFRWNRRTATEAPWIFYHFGPYSAELFETAQQTPSVRFKDPIELEGDRTFRACETVGVYADAIEGGHFTFRGIVDGVLKRWVETDLPTLLNHVYFHTEPMISARRGKLLDFSGIPDAKAKQAVEKPVDIGELISTEIKERLRNRLAEKRQKRSPRAISFRLELDDDAIEAMRRMDAEDMMHFPDARIVLDEGARGS